MDKDIVEIIKKHDEWRISVEISNDNAKAEPKVTVKVRGDGECKDALEEAHTAFETELEKLAKITK